MSSRAGSVGAPDEDEWVAIAAGLADGVHYGMSTKAALVARGLAELAQLGTALGHLLTFLRLAGG